MISEERKREIWSALDAARDRTPMHFLPMVRSLRAQGLQLDVIDLVYVQQRTSAWHGPLALPIPVATLYSHLIGSRECVKVLVLAGDVGLLGAWLAAHGSAQHIDAVTRYVDARELVAPLELPSLKLHIGTVDEVRAQLAPAYDAIVATPPVGLKRERRTLQASAGQIELRDDPSSLLIAEVAEWVSPEGFLAFVMAPRFAREKGSQSVRRNLAQFGLHLSALLTFRPGTFAGTNVAFDLAVMERTKHERLFVAQVPEDSKAQAELIARLWQRKEGSTPGQGWLVSEDRFPGLSALEAQERARQLAAGKGLEAIQFGCAVNEIRLPKRRGTEFEHCEEHPQAVYLPQMARTPATTRRQQLPERLKSYLQLIVDPTVVLPGYLAELLNTPLGHAIREAAMTGTTTPRINCDLLRQGVLYLPPPSEQAQAMEALSSIRKLRSELTEVESQVWERPRRISDVLEAVANINHEDRFEDWLETLPFPLACILRSYHALDRTDKEKYERLLHFFEAFCAYGAIIHMSAFKTDDLRWKVQAEKLHEVLAAQNLAFEQPSFGMWRVVLERLASELRSMLNGKREDQEAVKALYRTADLNPLEMLSSKSLLGLMQRVNSFRNRWTGHGGSVSPKEAADRLELLRQDLEDLRGIVGTTFLQYQLIEPREAEILPGPLFRCRVRRVMGSNPQFEHQTVELTTPAVTGRLYLHNPGYAGGLELIPLVQVRDVPQPAGYFYNRLEKTGMRLVSYHFVDQTEVVGESDTVEQLLADLSPKEVS